VLAILAVVGRAGQLQLVQGGQWAAKAAESRTEHDSLPARRGSLLDRQGTPLAITQEFYHVGMAPREITDRTALVRAAAGALDILRMIGLETKAQLRPAGLTQIEMRKLELARAMAARPKLLISDEAMAGLSSAEVDDILTILFRLNEQGITIIMIEHIMRAVMRFSERIVVLDAGNRIAEGTPAEIVRNPAVEKAYLGE